LRGVALEPRAPIRIEPLDRVDQAEDPGLHEVGVLDVGRQAGREPVRDRPHEWRVVDDEQVAERAGALGQVGGPQLVARRQ